MVNFLVFDEFNYTIFFFDRIRESSVTILPTFKLRKQEDSFIQRLLATLIFFNVIRKGYRWM